MKLTGNALSMLLKRYRAVLGKCRTLNWLAGLVLAGGLVLGGVSGALATEAAPEPIKWNITSNEMNASEMGATAYQTTALEIIGNGSTGNLLIIDNTSGAGKQNAGGSTLLIQNANIKIDGTPGNWDATGIAGYNGTDNNPQAAAAASAMNKITGSNITIVNGYLTSGLPGAAASIPQANYSFTITGGSAINLAAASDISKAMLTVIGVSGKLQYMYLNGNSSINTTGKGGTILAPHSVLVVGSSNAGPGTGAINVAKGTTLNLLAGLSTADANSVRNPAYGDGSSRGSSFVIGEKGTVNVFGAMGMGKWVSHTLQYGGAMNVTGLVTLGGGTAKPTDMGGTALNLSGIDYKGQGSGIEVGAFAGGDEDSSLKVTNGGMIYFSEPGANQANGAPITIRGGNVEISGGPTSANGANGEYIYSRVWAGLLTISDGTVTVGNASAADGDYARWSRNYLSGYGGVNITGGTINLNAGSEIQAGGKNGATGLNISGGTITFNGTGAPYSNGTASILFSGADAVAMNALNTCKNTISGAQTLITVEQGKHGAILPAAMTVMSGGTINVNANGTLHINGIASYEQGSASTFVAGTNTPTFVQSGGTVNVTGTLSIEGQTTYILNGGQITGTGNIIIEKSGTAAVGNNASTAFNASTLKAIAGADLSGMTITNYGSIILDAAPVDGKAQVLKINGGPSTNLFAAPAGGTAGNVLVTKGKLDLGSAFTLTSGASGNFAYGSSANAGKITLNSTGVVQADALNLSNGTGSDAFAISSGKLVAGTTLEADNTVTGVATSATGTIQLGSSSVAATNGQVKTGITVNNTNNTTVGLFVEGGTSWTLAEGKTIDIQQGQATINGTLDASGTGTAFKTTATKGVTNIGANGTLIASATSLALGYESSDWTTDNIKQTITNNGVISVSGVSGITAALTSDKLTSANFKTLKAKLMTGSGLLKLEGVTFADVTDGTVALAKVTTSGDLVGADLGSDVVVTGDTNTAGDATPVSGGFGSVNITKGSSASGDITGITVTGGTGLSLAGNGDATANLITTGGALGNLVVGADGNASLGAGKVGTVSLTQGTTATTLSLNGTNAAGVQFADNTKAEVTGGTAAAPTQLGAVTAANTKGILSVENTNNVEATSIGADGAALGTLEITSGALDVDNETEANGKVFVTNLDLTSGNLTASGAVTIGRLSTAVALEAQGLEDGQALRMARAPIDGDIDNPDNDVVGDTVTIGTVADGLNANITATGGKVDINGKMTGVVNSTITSNGGNVELTGSTLAENGVLKIVANGGNVVNESNALYATSVTATAESGSGGDITSTGQNIISPTISADGAISAGIIVANGAAGATPGSERAASVSAKKINTANGSAVTDASGTQIADTSDLVISNGTLTLGDEDATAGSAQESVVAGNLNLTNVETRLGKADTLTVNATSGTNTISGGKFTADTGSTVTFTNAGSPTNFTNGVQASFDKLNGASPLNLTGSSADSPTRVAVNDIGGVETGTLTQGITVGNNAIAALGTSTLTDIPPSVDSSKGGLYVAAPINVSSKGIKLGSDTTTDVSSGGLAAGAGSSTVINAAGIADDGTQAAITGGTATVAPGAKLTISGAQVGGKYKVFDGTLTKTPAGAGETTGWDGANLVSDNPLVKPETIAADGTTTARLNSASNVMPKLDSSLVAAMNSAASQLAGVDSPDKGIQFLSRAISDKYLDAQANPDLAAQTIEGAARMVTIGAVPQMTRTANQAAAEAVTQRTSMAIPSSIQTQQATDRVALWIMPLYQSTNGARLEAGNMDADYHGGLGGIALGADYTFANAIRAGIAFNIGAGYATGGGDFADTTNNMNFWGLGAYAGWTGNNIGVSADVNFTSAYNKLTQDLPQSMGMRDLKADVRSYAFSTGLRGEYKLETSAVDITPHVGVRFMYLTTDDYKVKSEGTVLKGDGLNQNIWTFPIGVSFSKNIERSNGWHVKPMLDLAVVPAAGDIKAKENVRFSGTDYKAELETQVMDYITYQGVLGLEVGNQNLSFGLSGNTQFGEKTSGYGVLGSFRYEF